MKKWWVLLVLGIASICALATLGTWAAGTAPAAAALPGQRQVLVAPRSELHVCPAGPPTCDYASIQAAVDAAGTADMIKVAAGSYTDIHFREGVPQVVYISKTVTIAGGYTTSDWTTPDPAANSTVLDAQAEGRVVYITGTIAPVLQGLQITGGDATGLGGGPWSYDGAGGGIYVVSATATISNCEIHGNVGGRLGWGGGGGLYLWQSPSTLANSHIYQNAAGQSAGSLAEGGGLVISQGDATVTGNLFSANVANDSAGDGIGGAIYLEEGTSLLRDNIFRDNSASAAGSGDGGAIFAGFADNSLYVNTVLVDNHGGAAGDSRGGGFYAEVSSPRLLHTTIHSNTGGDDSGVFADGSTMALTNTILVSQSVGITLTFNSAATLNGVLWFGNGLNYGDDGTSIFTITGEISGTPLFLTDGYHVMTGSLAIDNGVDSGDPADIDGQARPYHAGYDLGADEWWPCLGLTGVTISGPTTGYPDVPYAFSAVPTPPGATPPITYTWAPPPDSGQGSAGATYTWATSGTYVITVTAENCAGTAVATHTISISGTAPICPNPLTGVSIAGPTSGFVGFPYDFAASVQPSNATLPITFTWTPLPGNGQGTPSATYSWTTSGTQTITVSAANCGGSASDEYTITIRDRITASVEPTVTITLAYTDPRGMTTTVEIPTDAVTQTTVIVFVPVFSPTVPISPSLLFANHAFHMSAYRGGLLPGFAFAKPVTITIHYSGQDVGGIDEDSLRLYYWTGSAWEDAVSTCTPASDYTRDPAQNMLSVPICHLSMWGMQGLPIQLGFHVYLPIVLRQSP
jgi:hypothetical protein